MDLDQEQQKALAARAAADLVESGQLLGLGSGTTVAYLLDALAARVRTGLSCIGVPTSERTAQICAASGIPVSSLDEHVSLDLDLDGADEVDPNLNLIKGRGGALLREKIVATASRRFVAIVDESKLVQRLGERSPVPVEIVPFGWKATLAALAKLADSAALRGDGTPFRTDNGNLIVDCRFNDLFDPYAVAAAINAIPGAVEHGLFLGCCSTVIVGHADGRLSRLERQIAG